MLIALGVKAAPRTKVPVFDEMIAERQVLRPRGRAVPDGGVPGCRRIPRSGKADQWEDVKFYQTVRVDPGKSRVAARLTDETPLLLDKQIGEGHVLVFASTFDNIS